MHVCIWLNPRARYTRVPTTVGILSNPAILLLGLSSHHDSMIYNQSDSQFRAFRQKEPAGLVEKGEFKVVDLQEVPAGVTIFGSRFVDEIKHKRH
jgi:hypothetical protein